MFERMFIIYYMWLHCFNLSRNAPYSTANIDLSWSQNYKKILISLFLVNYNRNVIFRLTGWMRSPAARCCLLKKVHSKLLSMCKNSNFNKIIVFRKAFQTETYQIYKYTLPNIHHCNVFWSYNIMNFLWV